MAEDWWRADPVADDGEWWANDRVDAPRRGVGDRGSVPAAPKTPDEVASPAAMDVGETDVVAQAVSARRDAFQNRAEQPSAISLDPRSDAGRDYPYAIGSTEMRRGSMTPGGRQGDAPELAPMPDDVDLLRRRGQEVAQGFSGVVQAVPRAAAIRGEGVDISQAEAAAGVRDEQRSPLIADLEERLADPSLPADQRAIMQRNLDDLRAGQAELTRRADAEIIPAEDRPAQQAAEAIARWTDEQFGVPPRDDSIWSQLAYGTGSMAAFVLPALVPGGIVATAQLGSDAARVEAYDRALEAGATREQAREASDFAAVLGMGEAVPIATALRILPVPLRNRVASHLGRFFTETAVNAGEEAAQEAIAAIGQNMIARGIYDPEQAIITPDVGEQALVGAILGGVLGGAGAIPRRPEDRLTEEDLASPLPNDVIAEGRAILDSVLSPQRPNAGVAPRAPAAPNVAAPRQDAPRVVDLPPESPLRPVPDARMPSQPSPPVPRPSQLDGADAGPRDVDAAGNEAPAQDGAPVQEGGQGAQATVPDGRVDPRQPPAAAGTSQPAPDAVRSGEPTAAVEGRYEIIDEVETVDGETRPTGRQVRLDTVTGDVSEVQAERAAAQSEPAAEPAPEPEGERPGPRRVFLDDATTRQVQTDADTFQYKGGGDADGVVDTLRDVRRFDPARAGKAILFERRDGTLVVADGHQRFGLARRAAASGQRDVGGMPAEIYREADGWTPQEVRVQAALKNIGEGSGSATDAARILRDSDQSVADLNLPPRSALVRDAEGLRRLSDDAFGIVVNGRASERNGAIVGRVVDEKGAQADILGLLTRLDPPNAFQAESIARQAAAETTTETQDSLFGPEEVKRSLYAERAKVLDNALKRLKMDRQTFRTLVDRGEAITSAGNSLDQEANRARLEGDGAVQAFLASQANMRGPISDALTEAARDLAARRATVGQAGQRLVDAVRAEVDGVGQAAPRADAGAVEGRGQGSRPAAAGRRDAEARRGEGEGRGEAVAAEPTADRRQVEDLGQAEGLPEGYTLRRRTDADNVVRYEVFDTDGKPVNDRFRENRETVLKLARRKVEQEPDSAPQDRTPEERFPDIADVAPIYAGPGGRIEPRPIAPGKPLYREMSVSALDDAVRVDRQPDLIRGFVSDNRDLAIGQGINKDGVLVTFRPDSLSGEVNRKPGTTAQTGMEYRIDMRAPRAVARVEIQTDRVKALSPLTERLLRQEFTRQEQDRNTVFTREGLEGELPSVEPTLDSAVSRDQRDPADTRTGDMFAEPEQPRRTVSQRDRAEIEARQQQSAMRRLDQERVEDDADTLFGAGAQPDMFARDRAPNAPSRENFYSPVPMGDARFVSPEAAKDALPNLRAELDRLNLGRVKVALDRSGRRRQGAFEVSRFGALDILIGQSLDPDKTLYHESVHAMRFLDLFTAKEWEALATAAEGEWLAKYDIAARYPHLMQSERVEEAIAEAFADFAAGREKPTGLVRIAVDKVQRLLRAIRAAFTGMTADDVFLRAFAGEIGARDASNAGFAMDVGMAQDQFAGPQAANADIHGLARAKDMIEAGVRAERVRQETGWFQGPDKRWRYEISDEGAAVDMSLIPSIGHVAKVANARGQYPVRRFSLGQLLKHDRLYAAYPDLAEVSVTVRPDDFGYKGSVQGDRMSLHPQSFESEADLLSTVLHEVQHLIQSREGFARGGNLEMTPGVKAALRQMATVRKQEEDRARTDYSREALNFERARDLLDHVLMWDSYGALMRYANHDRPSGVRRLILQHTDWLHHPKLRDAKGDISDRARDLYYDLHSIPKPHRMVERNAFLGDWSFRMAQLLRDAVPARDWDMFETDERKPKSVIAAVQREVRKAREALAPLYERERNRQKAERLSKAHDFAGPFEVYQALAGEVEARMTQSRARMTDAERQARAPNAYTDAGVDPESVIVVFRDGEIEVPYVANSIDTPQSRDQAARRDGFAAEFLSQLASVDDLFRYPRTAPTSVPGLFEALDPDVRYVGEASPDDVTADEPEAVRHLFRTGNGTDFYVYVSPDEVWFDVSRLQEGEGGSALYAAVADFAHATNRTFIGDPAGLSAIALRRRTEAMLSSALKHGTTEHLAPHEDQIAGNADEGVPPLVWREGDDDGNVQSLIEVSVANLAHHVPEFQRARFDFRSRTYVNSQGAPISDEDLRAWAAKFERVRAARAGRGTLKRGILLNTLLRAESGQRPGLLEQVLRQPAQLVEGAGPVFDQAMPAPKPALGPGPLLGEPAHIPDRRVWDELTTANRTIWERLAGAKGAWTDLLDKARFQVQDRMLPLRRAQEAIQRQQGVELPDELNAYGVEETFSGRAGARLDDIQREVTEPIIRIIAEADGLTPDIVGDWLTARHAQERNERIAKINAAMPDGASGMTTAEAKRILSEAKAGPHAAQLEEIGKILDGLRDRTLNLRIEAGLITREDADLLRKMYRHYVPLKGFAETDVSEATLDISGVGGKYNVRGPETKRALGRRSRSFNPLMAAIVQAQEVAIRAEKNRVAQAVYRLASEYPSENLWTIKGVTEKRFYNKTTGMVETRAEAPAFTQLEPNEMAVKVDGKEKRIVLHDPRLAEALGRVGADQVHGVVALLGAFNRFRSLTITTLDPEFTVRNAFRDIQAALLNVGSIVDKSQTRAIQKAMVKNWPKALRAAYQGQKGKVDTEWQQHYREFVESGAKVSFFTLDNPEAGLDAFNRRIDLARGSVAARTLKIMTSPRALFDTDANPVLGTIERANIAVDNAVRLAAFVEARKLGLSQQKAASLAKNLTVNFNRRGAQTGWLNSLFLFFNAAVQGLHVTAKTMFSKRGAAIGGSLIVMGIIDDLVSASLSEEDDDGELAYDKVPDYINAMNWTISTGDDAITIPLPYVYALFPYIGRQIGKAYRGVKDEGEAMADVAVASLQQTSPIGVTDGFRGFLPTVAQLPFELATNTDWLGRPIRPEDNAGPYTDYGPDAYKFYGGATQLARAIADTFNRATGGTIAEPGIVDVSPEYIDHTTGFFFGGLGRFVSRNVDLAAKLIAGEDIEARNVPFIRSLGTTTGEWLDQDRFYRFRREVQEAIWARDTAREAGERISPRVVALSSLEGALKAIERQRQEVRRRQRELELAEGMSQSARQAREGRLDDAENSLYIQFNRRFLSVMGPQGE